MSWKHIFAQKDLEMPLVIGCREACLKLVEEELA